MIRGGSTAPAKSLAPPKVRHAGLSPSARSAYTLSGSVTTNPAMPSAHRPNGPTRWASTWTAGDDGVGVGVAVGCALGRASPVGDALADGSVATERRPGLITSAPAATASTTTAAAASPTL